MEGYYLSKYMKTWTIGNVFVVELLPEAIQQQVREGKLGAQVAMKYLVPVARVDADDCARMATVGSGVSRNSAATWWR
jgi:hypothetical protein